MATYSGYSIGGTTGTTVGNSQLQIVKLEWDLGDIQAGLTAAGITIASGDGIKLLDIPADTYFELVRVEIVETITIGTSGAFILGDSQDDDEFVTTQSTLTAGTDIAITKETFTNGKVLTAADDLILEVSVGSGSVALDGKIRIVALIGNAERRANAVTPIRTA